MKDHLYSLPFSLKNGINVSNPTGDFAHENFPESKYAIDFSLDINTPIFAAREGEIILVKNDSEWSGLDPGRALEVNRVAIDHGDGTGAEYIHFAAHSIVVKKGQHVKTGDFLGCTGYSGVMDTPHIHFNAFRFIKKNKGISIPVTFAINFND